MIGLRLTTLVLVLPILTACGGAATPAALDLMLVPTQAQSEPELESSPPTPAAPAVVDILGTIKPCEFLSADEIETAASVAGTEHTRRLPQPHDHEPERWHKLITLTLTYQTAEQFKAEKEASVAMLDLEMVPVEDLADEAVFYSGVLRVRVGGTVL